MVLRQQLWPISDRVMPLREHTRGGLREERGFTLIEVMFASVYLAVGLLAIVAMIDLALGRVTDARRLTVSTNLATEMIERIRFNAPANSKAISGTYPSRQFLYSGIKACSSVASSYCSGESQGNTASNATANGDYNQWRARLKAADTSGSLLLPNAVATVTSADMGTQALGQVLVTVTVAWDSGIRRPTLSMSTVVAPL